MGGRVGRISYSVRHSYWSLDTNNGRAKEDLVCAYPLLLSCCPVVPAQEVYGIEDQAAPFGAALYIWKIGLAVCLSSVAPPPLHRRQRGT